MKIETYKIVTWLVMVTIPFGNVTYIFGFQDSFSLITIFLTFVFLIINFLQNKTSKYRIDKLGIIFIISLIITLINIIFSQIELSIGIKNVFKIIVIIFIMIFAINNKNALNYFLKNYYKVYLLSLIISLPIYFIFRFDEFVFFDGSQNRFAGLHFELFNFIFSSFLFLISWNYSGKNKLIGFFLFIYLIVQSQSNILYPYLLLMLFLYFFNFILKYKSISAFIILLILFSPLIIGFFLNELSILNIFSVREVSSFDSEGSALFVRLYPYLLAADYISIVGINFLIPIGYGFFEGLNIVESDPMSFGGTGSPKAIVDLGLIFFVISYYVIKKFNSVFKKIISPKSKFFFSLFYLINLMFISFGSGFFNFVSWFLLINSNANSWNKN